MDVSTVELQWWILAVLLYGVGDYVTTVLAVRRADVIEANPAVVALLSDQPGPLGFGLLKGGALVVCFLGFLAISESPIAIGVPVGIALLGGLVTLSNAAMIVRTD
ncbi:MAG: hypothetical protein U9O06_04275 [Euryarchaeota archaeon]|nr:hypothetical protein [Euryarchaeota archaeon]